jgi:hypothetical protein
MPTPEYMDNVWSIKVSATGTVTLSPEGGVPIRIILIYCIIRVDIYITSTGATLIMTEEPVGWTHLVEG